MRPGSAYDQTETISAKKFKSVTFRLEVAVQARGTKGDGATLVASFWRYLVLKQARFSAVACWEAKKT